MNIQKLLKAAQQPEIYTKGTATMWVDPYISTQLLKTHLNPDIELASRKPATISQTIDWMLAKIPGDRLQILDMGCGPGLYAEKLAQRGHRVTGIDFSAHSIGYARESAARNQLDITYLEMDYLELEDENRYDLIMMIFADFGVLLPEQRQRVLTSIHRALKPGGAFLFDVMNNGYQTAEPGSRSWDAAEKGFWRERPYLALSETFAYEESKVTLDQHIVIEEDGPMVIYRFWNHKFTHADLQEIMAAHGFSATECHDRVIPGCEMYRSEDVTFCIAIK